MATAQPLHRQSNTSGEVTGRQMLAGIAAAAAGAWLARRLLDAASAYSFKGRTVVITGGSRGLGFAMARRFADEGARVWLVARSPAGLEEAADDLRARGGDVRTFAGDVRRLDDIHHLLSTIAADGQPVDVLVNNAGVISVGPVEHAQEEDFRDALATHFWAPLDLIRATMPYMRRGGEGRVVNIASIGGRVAVPHLAAYNASKFALVGLSETLRAELVKDGVYVTTVTPGLMRTGSYVNVRVRGRHPDEFRWFTAMSATSLTSMSADRAARMIVDACRVGRATITPGWQARAAIVINALAPNLYSAINVAADRWMLPQPDHTPRADAAQSGRLVDPGPVKKILADETRREFHQPQPAWVR